MEWAVLNPKYILFSLTLNSKLAQGSGRGLGGGEWIGCGYELLTVFHYPLSWAIAECTKEKKGSCPMLTWKKNVFWAKAIEWITVLKYLEHKTWKSALVTAHEKFDVLTGPNSDDCGRLFLNLKLYF